MLFHGESWTNAEHGTVDEPTQSEMSFVLFYSDYIRQTGGDNQKLL